MNNAPSSNPKPIQPVRVQRHKVNWEASDLDLAEITGQRAISLAPQIATGCWFLNPRYTVSSPAPTAEFFQTVLRLRSTWLRTCRQILGNSGQRSLVRQSESLGRRGTLLDFSPELAVGADDDQPSWSVQRSGLSKDQRREVIQAGQFAKQLSFSGILFIDGNLIQPSTWQASAELVVFPATHRINCSTNRRWVDLS